MRKKSFGPKWFLSIFHNPVTAWIILAISLTITVAAYFIAESFVSNRAKDRFEFITEEFTAEIQERLKLYEQVLWGGVGLMRASEFVDRSEFALYVETLHLDSNWPGIQGVGFSVPVSPEKKTAHEEAIKAEGFSDYQIRPEGDRDLYTAIVFLEPFDWRNQRAFGYDMWSNDMRQEAMARSRDTGQAATSGVITLVQETEDEVQKGFLTYVPVYEKGEIPATVGLRREQFSGWIYAAFRAGNLISTVMGNDLQGVSIEVYDGEKVEVDSLLFDSNERDHSPDNHVIPEFYKTTSIEIQGRVWTLHFETSEIFSDAFGRQQPMYVALAGSIVDVLLFFVIYSLYLLNKQATNTAKERNVVFEQAPNALIMINERGTIDLTNQQTNKLFNYGEGELIGQSIDVLVPDESRLNHPKLRTQYLNSPVSRSMGEGRDLSGMRSDGSLVPIEIGLNPIVTSQGNFVIVSVLDISDRIKNHEKLREINFRLQDKNKEMEQFIYTVSHDLKSPLVTIGGFSSSLIRDLSSEIPEKQLHRLERISANVEHMEALLNDLLQLSRVVQHEVEKEYIDLNEILQRVESTLEKNIEDSNAVLNVSGPLIKIYANSRLLYQCLQNLVSNAIQYRDKNRPLRISISTEQHEDSIDILVADTGIGIDQRYHDRIFQIFERLDVGEGTGVGLSIVKTITEKHGGNVKLESCLGAGSTFILSFPKENRVPENHD